MRHLIKGRQLNRTPTHLLAMKRNQVCSLFAYERIITTVAKAKELKVFAEKLITLAKKASAAVDSAGKAGDKTPEFKAAKARALQIRRRLMAEIGGKRRVIVKDNEVNIVDKLINDLGPRFQTRPGGYTRIMKRTERRLGDAAPTAFIELLSASEKAAAPAAPTVSNS